MYPTSDSTINAATRALQGLWARQQTISENIANVDTPGYKAARFDFEGYMQRARARDAASVAGHVYRQQGSSVRTDGNNVDMDKEMVLLTQNALRYNAVMSQLGRKIDYLHSVIRDS